jgi:hypothetical protein
MISLFREKRIDELFQIVNRNIQTHVSQMQENQILLEDSRDLAARLATRFSIKPLVMDLEKRDVNVILVNLPWDAFPPDYDVTRGKSYPCAKVLYTIKFSGDVELLSAEPYNSSLFRTINADINEGAFTIGYQTLYGRPQLSDEIQSDVKRNVKQDINSINDLIPVLNNEVKIFNDSLEDEIYQIIEKMKEAIKNRDDQNQKLNDL